MAFMLGWMVLCMTGLVGPIANTAHAVGFVTGIAAAWGQIQWKKRRG
jgi:membrane associated rhomboid family serine protease